MIVFDDSYEHEAANMSETQERVILLIDIWHPDLHQEEINQITGMFKRLEEMIKMRKASGNQQKP
jgi:aspartyl/asparaginyl beta-hydroxylase (cupin superfamily)